MKKYRVAMTTGVSVIEADYIKFEPGHVTLWRHSEPHSGRRDVLVRAIHNPAVEEVREVES